nr:DUF6456 domain-containing protein [Rhodothalassium salexigens]
MNHDSAPLSRFELRVLRKCTQATNGRRSVDGGLRLGSLSAPASVAENLLRRGLLAERDGRIIASAAGAALLARTRAQASGDADDYAAQHRVVVHRPVEPGDRRTVAVNLTESPLKALARRKTKGGRPLLTERQVAAGDRLRTDFDLAGLTPRVTGSYAPLPPSRGRRPAPRAGDPTDRQIDARRRYQRALDAMGPGLADIAVRVCCYLEGLEAAERALHWPVRSGKLVLGLALDRAADHYDGRTAKNNHIGTF